MDGGGEARPLRLVVLGPAGWRIVGLLFIIISIGFDAAYFGNVGLYRSFLGRGIQVVSFSAGGKSSACRASK